MEVTCTYLCILQYIHWQYSYLAKPSSHHHRSQAKARNARWTTTIWARSRRALTFKVYKYNTPLGWCRTISKHIITLSTPTGIISKIVNAKYIYVSEKNDNGCFTMSIRCHCGKVVLVHVVWRRRQFYIEKVLCMTTATGIVVSLATRVSKIAHSQLDVVTFNGKKI